MRVYIYMCIYIYMYLFMYIYIYIHLCLYFLILNSLGYMSFHETHAVLVCSRKQSTDIIDSSLQRQTVSNNKHKKR